MIPRLARLLGSAALTALFALPAMAQEYSDGTCGQRGRGPAVLTPVEAYGLHPPGPGCCRHGAFRPYYAPLAPTPTCNRWHTTCYTPYYIGYCPKRLCRPKPAPYGADGWGPGPMPNPDADLAKLNNFGPYTSVLNDDTTFWLMGGNGMVPYGTPRPPHNGPPDLVDMIQSSRAQSGGGACGAAPGAALATGPSGATPPPIMPRVD